MNNLDSETRRKIEERLSAIENAYHQFKGPEYSGAVQAFIRNGGAQEDNREAQCEALAIKIAEAIQDEEREFSCVIDSLIELGATEEQIATSLRAFMIRSGLNYDLRASSDAKFLVSRLKSSVTGLSQDVIDSLQQYKPARFSDEEKRKAQEELIEATLGKRYPLLTENRQSSWTKLRNAWKLNVPGAFGLGTSLAERAGLNPDTLDMQEGTGSSPSEIRHASPFQQNETAQLENT